MKIGIDTFGCDHGRSGLGTYILSFAANVPQTEDIKVELFGSELDKFTYSTGKNVTYQGILIPDTHTAERLWHLTKLKKFVKQQKYDAVILPLMENGYPIKCKIPSIVIVNLIFSSMIKNKSIREKKLLTKTLKNATKIIASSRYIRDDLINSGFPEDKIILIYNGIDHKLFYPQVESNLEQTTIKAFAIKKPYFIYPSRLTNPEKKHIELIKAFEMFKKRTGLPHRLVLAGAEGDYAEEIHKVVMESPYITDIFLTGYFPHDSFPQLFSHSEGCIFPSIDEGVGLSVFEAMSVGIPVACTDKSALSEIDHKAYLNINPDEIEQFSFAIEKIATDEELRTRLFTNGLSWAKMYNWETSVNQTLEIVKQLKKKAR